MELSPEVEGSKPRRRWRRRLLLGVVALALLVVLAVALAPQLVSRFGRGRIEAAFAQRFEGSLQLARLDLGWTGRQRVEGARLLAPDGSEVARASVDAPGLLSLLLGRGRRLGRIDVVASADLVADEAGVTNLDRALAPRGAEGSSAPTTPGETSGEPSSGGLQETLEGFEADLDLRVERLSWSDPKTRAAGGPLVVEGFQGSFAVAHGGSIDAHAQGELSGSASGEITLVARVERPFAAPSSNAPPSVDLDLSLAGLPVALIDTIARQQGRLADLLGERVTLQVHAKGTPQSGEASLQLDATRAKATARARLEGGVLHALEGWAVDASLDLEPTAVENLLGPLLPAGVALTRRQPAAPLHLAVPRLSLPVAKALDANARGGGLLETLLADGELGVDTTLGGWALTAPQWLGSEVPLGLDEVGLEVRLVPSAGAARLDLSTRARLAQPESGTLSLSVGSPDLLALLGAGRGQGEGRADARLELGGVPTALVERITRATDRLRPALGDAVDLDLALEGALAADGALRGRVQAGVQSPEGHLTARIDGALPRAEREDVTLPALEARGELGGLELAWRMLPPERRALVHELVGGSLAFDLTTAPASPGASSIALQLTAARAQVALTGELAPGSLHLRGEPGLTLSARPSNATLRELVGASLPSGASLELREEDAAAQLTVRSLDLPLPEGQGSAGGDLASLLAEARGEVKLVLPALVWRQPPAAGEGAAVPVELSALQALVTLAPATGLSAQLSGSVSGQGGQTIDVRLTAPDPAGLLAEGGPSAPAHVEAHAPGLPTALVDAFAAQKGLLVDVLGPTLDLDLAGSWPERSEPLVAKLSSTGAHVSLTARLEDGVLVATQDESLVASTPLTPLYSERIVGRLVPLLVGLTKPPDAPPVGLTVDHFRLPLDGDLGGLDADVVLDLNQVAYRLLPGLEGLGQLAETAQDSRTITLPPLHLPIRKGVVTYDDLPLQIGGKTLAFHGSFDLKTLTLDFASDVPLSALGPTVARELDKVRDVLDPATPVPIQLTGSWSRPRLSIGKEFLESALQEAAKGALQRGLEGLLDRKKKKDGG